MLLPPPPRSAHTAFSTLADLHLLPATSHFLILTLVLWRSHSAPHNKQQTMSEANTNNAKRRGLNNPTSRETSEEEEEESTL